MADVRCFRLRSALAAAVVVTVVAAVPAAAGAATIGMVGGITTGAQVEYTGTDGERNQPTITGSPTSVTITDPGATISTLTADCTVAQDGKSVTCTPTAPITIRRLTVGVGGTPGDPQSIVDRVTGFPVASPLAQGGIVLQMTGAGTIDGGPSAELLTLQGPGASGAGGGGDDFAQVTGGGAFAGGEGDDSAVFVGDGSVDGGPGSDGVATFQASNGQSFDPVPLTIRLDAAAATTGNGGPGQQVTIANVENAYGGPLDDTLTGSAVSNVIAGFGGSDTIDGGPGSDDLRGGPIDDPVGSLISLVATAPDGANVFRAVDGQTDLIDCTGGTAGTTVTADTIDSLTGCDAGPRTTLIAPTPPTPEVLQVPVQVPTPFVVPRPRDTSKPKARKVKVPTPAGKALRKGGRYAVTFTPSEAVTAQVELIAAGKVASVAKAGDLVLASRSVKAGAGKRTTVRVAVAKQLRRLLKAKRRLTVTLKLTDGGGNVTSVTRKLRIRG